MNSDWRSHDAPQPQQESTISDNWQQNNSATNNLRQQETAALADKWRQNDAPAGGETGARIKDAADLKWRNLESGASRSSLEAGNLKWRPNLEASGGAVSGPWRVSTSSAEQLVTFLLFQNFDGFF